jgi:hypothetical protein
MTDIPQVDAPELVQLVSEPEPKYVLEIKKVSSKSLNDEKMKSQLDYIIHDRTITGTRLKKWQVEDRKTSQRWNSLRRETEYTCRVFLKPLKPDNNTDFEFTVLHKLATKAAGTQRWTVVPIDEDELDLSGKSGARIEIIEGWKEAYFDHIYGRDEQIEVVMSSIEALEISDCENRFHTVLHGPPACGKTEIVRAFKNMLGEEAVLEYDATSTTQAGAIKDLNERDVMPKLLVVEEMEKTDENSLRWMLSILDHRGEIRKTNYRETIQKEVKLMCLATVNDYELFKKIMYGALASRFTNHLYCDRPNDAILRKILSREIAKVQGDYAWIDPAVEFALAMGITDPRKVTSICLCGRENLLDGSYQDKVVACMPPLERTKWLRTDAKKVTSNKVSF